MDFDRFSEELTKRLREELDSSYDIFPQETEGLNGTVCHRLLAGIRGECLCHGINLDECYSQYKSGVGMEKLAGMVTGCLREGLPVSMAEVWDYNDWYTIKPRIYMKLVNTGKNRRLLRDIPHRHYLDLSRVYYARLRSSSPGECASILIRNEHMQYWGVDEGTLFETAMKNMKETDKAVLKSMDDILAGYIQGGRPSFMYVLSNRERLNGAVQICNKKALRKAAETLGGDLWVIPSSIHEAILIPCSRFVCGANELAEMIGEINKALVAEEEILSYHVYQYNKTTGELAIAA